MLELIYYFKKLLLKLNLAKVGKRLIYFPSKVDSRKYFYISIIVSILVDKNLLFAKIATDENKEIVKTFHFYHNNISIFYVYNLLFHCL